ncbi:MAG: 30S ribosomal protein S17 [Candidatus Uhrbacteria bacterium]|nr:30S ribosomal protein S17 [Candidatus Uhrbacteria bacterium]
MANAEHKPMRRRLTGVVVSDKMDKTIVVRVDRTVEHAKYGKRYITSQKFMVHDELNASKPGEQVTIEETRPLSARKRWRVITKA